jgi:chemotaxis signal transduction protein
MAITSAIDLPPAQGLPNRGELQLVGFQVGSEEVGVDILRAREIIRLRRLTRVPTLPGVVEGIVVPARNTVPRFSFLASSF